MKIPFYKCNSKGNSFIIIFPSEDLTLTSIQIQNICNSAHSHKVDGLIFLDMIDNSNMASMNYYNNDGTWETFCLNGMACCSLIIQNLYDGQVINTIVSNNKSYNFTILDNNMIEIQLDSPTNMEFSISSTWRKLSKINFDPLLIDDLLCYYLYSGAKHIVIYSEDNKLFNDDVNLEKILKKIRYNKLFLPDGVNVNIYRYKNIDTIQVKTYEKGVEAMMSSCSSGSYACAYHYYENYLKNMSFNNNKINILNDGGRAEVKFGADKDLFLSNAEIEYKGELDI